MHITCTVTCIYTDEILYHSMHANFVYAHHFVGRLWNLIFWLHLVCVCVCANLILVVLFTACHANREERCAWCGWELGWLIPSISLHSGNSTFAPSGLFMNAWSLYSCTCLNFALHVHQLEHVQFIIAKPTFAVLFTRNGRKEMIGSLVLSKPRGWLARLLWHRNSIQITFACTST